jgi:alpha-glucosidase
MYFRKFHHPLNFVAPQAIGRDGQLRFTGRPVTTTITAFGDDVFRFEASGKGWERNHSLAGLTPAKSKAGSASLGFEKDALVLRDGAGKALLTGVAGRPLTVSGESWLMEFLPEAELRFFGLGEKHLPWEKKKVRTKFWNTDAWGDFHIAAIREASYDPAYVSIPYLAIKRGDTWIGILIDCPEAPVICLPDQDEGKSPWFAARGPSFHLGAEGGKPSVWFLVGPTLPELTRKLQKLCGPTPLPPLWALGHQQCRWGYQSPEDLKEVVKLYKKHRIPNDGVWLDIEYMDAFKVFTWNPEHWSGRGRVPKELRGLRDQGHPVVPILDPGVKVERNYDVYESGLKAGIFCKTREGIPYTGFVWPGETAFPDYSTAKGRAWWADQVATWAKDGVGGAWLDMNDPSVGSAELGDMRFGGDGSLPHETHHNQYGLGMAIASREGFLKADPNRRPFLLCRSGWIGSSRHTAIWTGDNYANWTHLKGSIALSMSLAISGVPFNGPDVPGFGGDVGRELAVAWYKAGFLFPFFRNHSEFKSNRREPWRFGPSALKQIGGAIRLRYRLLPYIYNLWIDQEERGEAVMRPLCYDHADGAGQDLAAVGDQFLCGPALLHAPVLDEGKQARAVVLPPGWWFNLDSGKWLRGGRTITVRQSAAGTPLFVRDGSLLALQPGEAIGKDNDLGSIELHAFVRPGGTATIDYRWDDGASFAYRTGKRSSVRFTAAARGKVLELSAETLASGAGALRVAVVVHGACTAVALTHGETVKVLKTAAGTWKALGKTLRTRQTARITLG